MSKDVSGPPLPSERARRVERTIGAVAVLGTAATVWLGLWVTPPDQVQGDLVRLVYIHPGVAWVALYLAFGLATAARERPLPVAANPLARLGPAGRRRRRGRGGLQRPHPDLRIDLGEADLGRVVGVGCAAHQHRGPAGPVPRVHGHAQRCPAEPRGPRPGGARLHRLVRRSRTSPSSTSRCSGGRHLHQGATVLNPGLTLKIHGSMAWTLLLGFVALTLVFAWMLLVRYRVGALEDWLGPHGNSASHCSEQPGRGRRQADDPDGDEALDDPVNRRLMWTTSSRAT